MYKVRLLSRLSQSTAFGAISKGTKIVIEQQSKKPNQESLELRTADFGLFKDLPERIPWDTVLEKRGI